MKLRIAAMIFGIVFIAAGIAWHLPFLMDNGLLLGLFQIDPLHNKVHLVSGLLGLAASSKARLARLYLKFFGGIYALLGILGFIFQDEFLAMQVNMADNILHIVLGLVAVMLGFKFKAPRKE